MSSLTKTRQRIFALSLCVLIVAATATLVMTRESRLPTARARPRLTPLVDEQPVKSARSMAVLASTREEQRLAQQALRLADHAVDLAFAEALRDATLHPVLSTPEAKEMSERVKRAEAQVKGDQDLIDSVKKDSQARKSAGPEIQEQLDLLQAQMELDKDDLEDAKTALARSGADSMSRIQRQFARYQAAQPPSDVTRAPVMLPAAESVRPRNLVAQFRAWRGERAEAMQLQAAREEALQKRTQLQQKHDSAEQAGGGQANESAIQTPPTTAGASQDQEVIATLRRLSERHKNLVDLNQRIQDHQDLADVYANWLGLVQARQQAALHGMALSLLFILLIVLGVHLADLGVDRIFAHLVHDQRLARTLRVVGHFVVQAVGVLMALFIVIGIPAQMPTILGLAGAGLTVALKDFIVAFFGWFALMGRNGIRVGDWVEIQGVVGEVAEISLLRTVLLETGNWNDPGHPTGRKVAFVNSYAIEGHYFNFSTSGQWLWDELQILVPPAENPYPILEGIQKLVTAATANKARMAEEEWHRATHRDPMQSFSAAPAINLRPTMAGIEVHVRYITRANERYDTRNQLYQEIVALLHQKQPAATTVGTPRETNT